MGRLASRGAVIDSALAVFLGSGIRHVDDIWFANVKNVLL